MKIFIEPVFSKYYQKYPLVLADIGASGGIESNWKSAQKYLQFIGFEPDETEFLNLKRKENGKVRYLNTEKQFFLEESPQPILPCHSSLINSCPQLFFLKKGLNVINIALF